MDDFAEDDFSSVPAPVEEATFVAPPQEEEEDLFDAAPEDAPLDVGGMGELPNGVGAAAAAPLPAVMLEDEFASPAETTCFSAAPADDLAAASEGTPLPAMTFSAPTNALELYQKAQYERLQAKEAGEKAEKAQRREAAKKEKEDLYTQRVKELEAKARFNRENQTARVFQTDPSSTLWENVYSLVDMGSKVAEGRTDLKRMRQMLVKLKHDPPMVATN